MSDRAAILTVLRAEWLSAQAAGDGERMARLGMEIGRRSTGTPASPLRETLAGKG